MVIPRVNRPNQAEVSAVTLKQATLALQFARADILLVMSRRFVSVFVERHANFRNARFEVDDFDGFDEKAIQAF